MSLGFLFGQFLDPLELRLHPGPGDLNLRAFPTNTQFVPNTPFLYGEKFSVAAMNNSALWNGKPQLPCLPRTPSVSKRSERVGELASPFYSTEYALHRYGVRQKVK